MISRLISNILISSPALFKKQRFKNCLYKNWINWWKTGHWFGWESKTFLRRNKQCFNREILVCGAFHLDLFEDSVTKGVYLHEFQLKKWSKSWWMLPVRWYLHFDYDVFEGIQVDFFIIVLRFFQPYFIAPPTATQLTFSNQNNTWFSTVIKNRKELFKKPSLHNLHFSFPFRRHVSWSENQRSVNSLIN